ncbi:MAG TPA: ABC transporter ATP-binding protein [Acidimicrobiales bacterium]|nr:ABC transporter ATP-binding protein [Acidimicrobiales bacterium]
MSQTSSAEAGAPASTGPAPAPVPPSPAVVTMGLHKRYGRAVAVRSLSVSVGRGEVFGFLGPNGAGKTTVVKMLLGLIRPTGGEGLVLGAPLGDRETRRRVGYLPELFRFQPWLTAREVLQLHCRLLEMPRARWSPSITDALQTVGLAARADDKVAGFSKGMQQRLGLGAALLGEPELVVLDEPTSALDPVGRHDVRQITRQLRSRGATVFLNTHLLEEAEQVCDRVAVIDGGSAVATGTLTELLGRHVRVRLKVSGLAGDWWLPFSGSGTWRAEGEWTTAEGVEPGRIPDLVACIVGRGGRVEAVVPEHQSLEDRFLELLGDR